nr:MAG TPA: hypothetical protein [Caudoviricetes sp.]
MGNRNDYRYIVGSYILLFYILFSLHLNSLFLHSTRFLF